MSNDSSAKEESEFKFSDLFCVKSVLSAAVQELCHYHPMGVYYYVCVIVSLHFSYHYHFQSMRSSQFVAEMKNTLIISLNRNSVGIYPNSRIIWSKTILLV